MHILSFNLKNDILRVASLDEYDPEIDSQVASDGREYRTKDIGNIQVFSDDVIYIVMEHKSDIDNGVEKIRTYLRDRKVELVTKVRKIDQSLDILTFDASCWR